MSPSIDAVGRVSLVLALSLVAGTAQAGNDVPKNPYLADSAWPMSHHNPYIQGSSPLKGPDRNSKLSVSYEGTALVNITLCMSAPYSDGTIVGWGSSREEVYKVKRNRLGNVVVIDTEFKGDREFGDGLTLSGAYTLLDRDNNFYTPVMGNLGAYTDATPGNPNSPIKLARTFELPPEALHGTPEEDPIVGVNMTYDGWLAIATKHGTVAVISRDFKDFHYVMLGDYPLVGEQVSNSIAVDEDGGIYVVTAEHLYRVQWTGEELSLDEETGAWRAAYENRLDVPGGILSGSGSTPALMGTGEDEDKFVVITDGQKLTNIVLFWRGEIPGDWQPLESSVDRRIAAQRPVDYGDGTLEESVSEQSVLVSGYGAVIVRNRDFGRGGGVVGTSTARPGDDLGTDAERDPPPYGVQKFEWNPVTRQLDMAWVNVQISCPNGIPTMSEVSNLMYCVGQRDRVWNIEALDWTTGAPAFYRRLGYLPIYDSLFAATQIGANGEIWSGTGTGVLWIGTRR